MSVRTEGYIYNRQKMPIKHGLAHEQAQKKSTIWRTKKRRKEHGLVHEETQKTDENSTIWCTTELRKEHDLVPYTRPLLHQAGAPP